jgi:hypothetical protein
MCRFWRFVTSQPLFVAALSCLRQSIPPLGHNGLMSRQAPYYSTNQATDETQAAYAMEVFEYLYQENINREMTWFPAELQTQDTKISIERNLTEKLLVPMHLFLLEAIDSELVVDAILVRYKERCEAFRGSYLRDLITTAPTRKKTQEGILALELQEYLHDRDIDVEIEPSTCAGRVDMKSTARGLLVDAKVFRGALSDVRNGFHQIYRYARHYNKPSAYLAIFAMTEKVLHLDLSPSFPPIHYVDYNGKRLYGMVVDICERETASVEKPKGTHTLTKADLMQWLEQETKQEY